MSKKINLECGHEFWTNSPAPSKGELAYCSSCADYVHVGPTVNRIGVEIYADYDWQCEGVRGVGFVGTCLATGCIIGNGQPYRQEERWDYYALKANMETHHLRHHSGSSLITRDIKIVSIPLTDEPPF